jgi:hypothetical protein
VEQIFDRGGGSVRAGRRPGLRHDPLRPARAGAPGLQRPRADLWTRRWPATASPCPAGSSPARPPIPRGPPLPGRDGRRRELRPGQPPAAGRPPGLRPRRRDAAAPGLRPVPQPCRDRNPRRAAAVHRKGATRALPPGHAGLPAGPRAPGSRCSSPARWAPAPTSWPGCPARTRSPPRATAGRVISRHQAARTEDVTRVVEGAEAHDHPPAPPRPRPPPAPSPRRESRHRRPAGR